MLAAFRKTFSSSSLSPSNCCSRTRSVSWARSWDCQTTWFTASRSRAPALRESDAILREEFAKNGLEGKVWQYFTIVPDYKSTGVKDNKRSWDWPVIIRAVNTRDAMTATIEEIPYELLHHITKRIVTEVPGVNRVLYDLTPKPTGTIEWE